MKKIVILISVIVVAAALFLNTNFFEHNQFSGAEYGKKIGIVHLPDVCSVAATPHMERGLALLHHMTYEDARAEFAQAVVEDPNCALGYWGQAMTYIHPLWSDPPSEEDHAKGQALIEKAKSIGLDSPQEEAYVEAVDAYYSLGKTQNEKVNLAAFEKGWEKVYREYPEDIEAAAFYALSHMATADPSDKSFAKQRKAGAIAEEILVIEPDHPGGHHYTIHAYDYPELADKALAVARSYSNIAPEIPHALHMPSHIFTRLGYWDESIDLNSRSANAALKHPVNGAVSLHYLHALDYLVYAYLQQGDDQKAMQVLNTLNHLEGPYQVHLATSYPIASIPVRYYLERQEWDDAAAFDLQVSEDYPMGKFPAVEAITYFSKALGNAKLGNAEEAKRALAKMETLRDKTAEKSPYWSKQVEIQRLAATAWLEYLQGNKEQGLRTMKEAADLEATTEKHPVIPGEILPARELYADMLLAQGRFKEAQIEYEKSLARSANRFNSLFGAGFAAEKAEDQETAAIYYNKLLEIAKDSSERQQVQHAKDFLSAR